MKKYIVALGFNLQKAMKIKVLEWIRHLIKGENQACRHVPIFSIDFHPTEPKIATGGQDNMVRVWSMADKTQLALLEKHTGAVNTVRWSTNGSFLASCSDDHNVIIWVLGEPKAVMEEGDNLEPWVCGEVLSGHTLDVFDLAWTEHFSLQILASASLDGSIRIWGIETENGHLSKRLIQVLEGHKGHASGVAFDTVHSTLASVGSDNVVRLWRHGDWTAEAEFSGNLDVKDRSTLFRRLSFSPEGDHLCVSNGVKDAVSCSVILSRAGKWVKNDSVMLHDAAVVCSRFCPRLFTKPGDPKKTMRSWLACGCEDGSITLWSRSLSRARACLKHACSHIVADLAWSSCGSQLFASSLDGTVMCFELSKEDLYGETPLAPEQQRQFLLAASPAGSPFVNTLESALRPDSAAKVLFKPPPVRRAASVPAKRGKMRIKPTLVANSPPRRAELSVQAATVPSSVAPPSAAQLTATAPPKLPRVPSSPALVAAPTAVSEQFVRISAAREGRSRGRDFEADSRCRLKSQTKPAETTVLRTHVRSADSESFEELAAVVESDPVGPVTKLTRRRHGPGEGSVADSVWEDVWTADVVVLQANRRFSAAGSRDGRIAVWNRAGSRLTGDIVLGNAIAALFVAPEESPFVGGISTSGCCRVWSISGPTPMCTLCADISPLLPSGGEVGLLSATVTGTGVLTVALRFGEDCHQSFAFDPRMQCWVKLEDQILWNPMDKTPCSSTAPGRSFAERIKSLGPISARLGPQAVRSQLEVLLVTAELLGNPTEFFQWLNTYVDHLVGSHDVDRLRMLCFALLSTGEGGEPAVCAPGVGQGAQTILGLEGRKLVKDQILPKMAAVAALQRLATEISQVLII